MLEPLKQSVYRAALAGLRARTAVRERLFPGPASPHPGRPAGCEGVPLKVLVEVGSLDRGGLEEMVYDLLRHLDRDLFAATVACFGRPGLVAERVRAMGIPVHSLNGRRDDFGRLLLRERFDVVQSHHSLLGAAVARRLRVPNLHVLHNAYVWLDEGSAFWRALAYRHVDRFVAVSSFVAEYARDRFGLHRAAIEVIPNGVDATRLLRGDEVDERRAMRARLGLAADGFCFLLLGTYEPRKGHRPLLQAFEQVARRRPEATLVCAGNVGSEEFVEGLRASVRAAGLETRVRLLGWAEPGPLYAACDALVLPSLVEGFSLGTLEALAMGRPLVLTDVGGARELLAGDDAGVLLPPWVKDLARARPARVREALERPPPDFVAALARALEQMCAERERFEAGARRAAERVRRDFAVTRVARRHEAALLACARLRRGRAP